MEALTTKHTSAAAIASSSPLYEQVREILQAARAKTYAAVNAAMVDAYWSIGEAIVAVQGGKEKADYGDELLVELSNRLTPEFGKGFDQSNLRNMRKFYLTFPIRDALRHELSWTHYRLLLKVQNQTARQFYLEEAIKSQWSTRQLARQINSFFYERLLSSSDKDAVSQELCNEGDNPTIGLVLCADKSDNIVKYTLPEGNEQIFAPKYILYLPTEDELKHELAETMSIIETEAEIADAKVGGNANTDS
jgi:hypothetical protein